MFRNKYNFCGQSIARANISTIYHSKGSINGSDRTKKDLEEIR